LGIASRRAGIFALDAGQRDEVVRKYIRNQERGATIGAPWSPTRISSQTSESSSQEHDRGWVEKGSRGADGALEILGEAAIAPEPGEEALDHPARGKTVNPTWLGSLRTISTTMRVALATRSAA